MRCQPFTSNTFLTRLIAVARANPKTTLAGLAAIAAALVPEHTAQISAIAAGVGLLLAGDAKTDSQ